MQSKLSLRVLALLPLILLAGCDSLPTSPYYGVRNFEAGLERAKEAIERKDWDDAYDNLEPYLYMRVGEEKQRALNLVEQYPSIAEAARKAYTEEELIRFKEHHPGELAWVEIRLEIFRDNIATPEEYESAEESFRKVYADEIAEREMNRAREKTEIRAARIETSIRRTCHSEIFAGLCLGEEIDRVIERAKPSVDITDGKTRSLIFETDDLSIGVISRDGFVVATLTLIPSTSWLEFATQKLRLERAFGVKWKRNVKLPKDAQTQEARENAIRSRQGFIKLATHDQVLRLSLVGPEGIRLEQFHPESLEAFPVAGDDDPWATSGLLANLIHSQRQRNQNPTNKAKIDAIEAVKPVVEVLSRPGTTVFNDSSGSAGKEAELYFRSCVEEGLRVAGKQLKWIDSDIALKAGNGQSDGDPKDVLASPELADATLIVLVDGTTYAESEQQDMSCASGVGGGICAGRGGLFMCGGGYMGAGCLGLAGASQLYRLVVTVVNARDWQVIAEHEVKTISKRHVIVGWGLPFWWTFGPDSDECSAIGREIGADMEADKLRK